jgi:hypothetical protein
MFCLDESDADLTREVIKHMKSIVGKHGCPERKAVTWGRIEALLDRLEGLEYGREEPDVEGGLRALLSLWEADPYLHSVVKEAVEALPFQYVRFPEFQAAAATVFRGVAARLLARKQTGPVLAVYMGGKSNAWMLALFLEHCRRHDAGAYEMLKDKLRVHDRRVMNSKKRGQCVLRVENATLLYLDDASYSGLQLQNFIQQGFLSLPSTSDMLVGVPFVSPAAARLLRPYAANVVKARVMPAINRKTLDGLRDVALRERKPDMDGWYPRLLRDFLGLTEAPCRTIFEHKVADGVSIPKFLSMPLSDISHAAFSRRFAAYIKQPRGPAPGFRPLKLKPEVSVRMQKAQDPKALALRLGRRRVLGDAFCPLESAYECFDPQYKRDDFELPGVKDEKGSTGAKEAKKATGAKKKASGAKKAVKKSEPKP